MVGMGAQTGKSSVEKSPAGAAASHDLASKHSDEPLAKVSRTGALEFVNVSVANIAGNVVIENLVVQMHEQVTHMKSTIEGQTGFRKEEQQLVFNCNVLDNDTFLSDICIKDGDMLTLLRCRTPSLLHIELIDDSVQVHGVHKLALQSEPLIDEVQKLEVTVKHWEDQNWGGKQARLFICLHDPDHDDRLVSELNLFGCLRTNEYDLAKHGSSPSITVGVDEEVVSSAKPGMVYKLRYQLGGGGGHTIKVQDWKCKIFSPGAGDGEPLNTNTKVVKRVGESGRDFDRRPAVGVDGHRLM